MCNIVLCVCLCVCQGKPLNIHNQFIGAETNSVSLISSGLIRFPWRIRQDILLEIVPAFLPLDSF